MLNRNKVFKNSESQPLVKDKMKYSQTVSVCNQNLIFLFLGQNICCGCSKEPSQLDGSFEHPNKCVN